MNALAKTPELVLTMTSLELVNFINADRKARAEEAGVDFPSKGFAKLEHADFMKKVLEVLGSNAGNFSGIYRDSRNREQDCYHFPKREACLMAMSYSYELQAKVFDRMTALEAGVAPAINLRDPKQLAAAALQLIEVNAELQNKVDEQQRKIEADAPKVEALNRLALADGSLCIRDAAKTLGVQEFKLKQVLQERTWIYRRPTGAGWLAYSDKLQSGLMEHKVTTGQKCDGGEWVNTQARVTAKGLTKLASIFQQQGMH